MVVGVSAHQKNFPLVHCSPKKKNASIVVYRFVHSHLSTVTIHDKSHHDFVVNSNRIQKKTYETSTAIPHHCHVNLCMLRGLRRATSERRSSTLTRATRLKILLSWNFFTPKFQLTSHYKFILHVHFLGTSYHPSLVINQNK